MRRENGRPRSRRHRRNRERRLGNDASQHHRRQPRQRDVARADSQPAGRSAERRPPAQPAAGRGLHSRPATRRPVDPRYGSVAGARADQQNVTLDGIDVNDPQMPTAYTSAIRMTQEALQEFRVSTSNYNAEMGRSSGPQVSLVTRSGTNQFDGSGYWHVPPHGDVDQRVLPGAVAGGGRARRARRRNSTRTFTAARSAVPSSATGCSSSPTSSSSRSRAKRRSCATCRRTRSATAC